MTKLPLSFAITVAWGDMDAYGHVNNTVYLRWCESARIAFFERIGLERSRQESGIGGILAKIDCRFKAPVVYPDQVRVQLALDRVGQQDFELGYLVFSEGLGKTVAEAHDRVVCYDYGKLQKSDWPESMLSLLRELHAGQKLSAA